MTEACLLVADCSKRNKRRVRTLDIQNTFNIRDIDYNYNPASSCFPKTCTFQNHLYLESGRQLYARYTVSYLCFPPLVDVRWIIWSCGFLHTKKHPPLVLEWAPDIETGWWYWFKKLTFGEGNLGNRLLCKPRRWLDRARGPFRTNHPLKIRWNDGRYGHPLKNDDGFLQFCMIRCEIYNIAGTQHCFF